MIPRSLSAPIAIAAAAILLALTWPQLVGLQNMWVIAHVVSLRGAAVVAGAVAVLVLILLTLFKPVRRLAFALATVLVVFVAANATILGIRGIGTDAAGTAAQTGTGSSAARSPGAVTVLSWNTLGDAPGAKAIADLALAQGADVITLPETTEATGVQVAKLMRDAGRPMWVHTIAFDSVSRARSTTLLISAALGDYTVQNQPGSGPPGNTNVLPTVVATPVTGTGPTVIAVHAVAPIQWEMSNWRSDLDWLAGRCNGGGSVIMAGDFNATVDHMAGREASAATGGAATGGAATGSTASAGGSNGSGGGNVLGACHDAALATGSGAVGTWPTGVPALLGSPIDHVLSSADWTVRGMSVIQSSDSAGSDHRPIVATLVPTPAG